MYVHFSKFSWLLFIVMQFSCVANNIPIVFHFRFSLKKSVPPIMHIVMDHPVGWCHRSQLSCSILFVLRRDHTPCSEWQNYVQKLCCHFLSAASFVGKRDSRIRNCCGLKQKTSENPIWTFSTFLDSWLSGAYEPHTMRTNLPKLLNLLIFCIYSLNFKERFCF